MALEPIYLPCRGGDDVADSGDHVEMRVIGRHLAVYGRFHGGDVTPDVPNYLNIEQARELFNWLGVFLHTYKGPGGA